MFTIRQILDALEDIQNPLVQYHLLQRNADDLTNQLDESLKRFNDLPDKEYCQKQKDKITQLSKNMADQKKAYESSLLAQAEEQRVDYQFLENNPPYEPPELTMETNLPATPKESRIRTGKWWGIAILFILVGIIIFINKGDELSGTQMLLSIASFIYYLRLAYKSIPPNRFINKEKKTLLNSIVWLIWWGVILWPLSWPLVVFVIIISEIAWVIRYSRYEEAYSDYLDNLSQEISKRTAIKEKVTAEYQELVEAHQKKLDNHPYSKTKATIRSEFPELGPAVTTINNLIKEFSNKWGSSELKVWN